MRGSNVCNCFLSACQGKVNRKLHKFTSQAKSHKHTASICIALIISVITKKFTYPFESTESRKAGRSALTVISKIPQLTSGKQRSGPISSAIISRADSHAGILDNNLEEGSCYDLIFLPPIFIFFYLLLLFNCETKLLYMNKYVFIPGQFSTDLGLTSHL